MLIISEIPETAFIFKLYRDRKFLKDLSVSPSCIVTSEDLPEFKDKKLSFTLKDDSGVILLEVSRAVLINGVACRDKKLKSGDTIILGPYRLVFEGVFAEADDERKIYSDKKKSRLTYIAEAAAVLVSISFLWYCTTQIPGRRLHDSGPVPDTAGAAQVHEAPPPESPIKEKPPSESASGALENIPRLVVYAPGELPAPRKTDILVIHAHPDDETLDCGLLIAEAADEGKSVGVVTFTDGESGFDFYPDRSIGGIYPDRELHGEDLAAVRVKEETEALEILGASVLVRLGLKNRPYTPEEASKPVPLLVEEWGGEKYLVDRLVDIITLLSPDIIVSPDGPSMAREHFEHEAVGYLCSLAVDSYLLSESGGLKAYLKLVDVQQLDAYRGTGIMTAGYERDRIKYLAIKRAALLKYQTQADACYYGVKRLDKYPFEYYYAVYDTGDTKLAMLSAKNRTE